MIKAYMMFNKIKNIYILFNYFVFFFFTFKFERIRLYMKLTYTFSIYYLKDIRNI
jgi:hypothetical protein